MIFSTWESFYWNITEAIYLMGRNDILCSANTFIFLSFWSHLGHKIYHLNFPLFCLYSNLLHVVHTCAQKLWYIINYYKYLPLLYLLRKRQTLHPRIFLLSIVFLDLVFILDWILHSFSYLYRVRMNHCRSQVLADHFHPIPN